MDMDNAQRVMDVLRAATEQNEGNTPIDPYKLPVQSNYVSQFCIDSQPILPPVMTAEKRQQMQQLRQQAIELDAKYKQPHAITLTLTVDQLQSSDTKLDRNSSSSSSNSSSKSSYCTINTTQRLPQLQQTETFIYDSTQQQQEQQKMIQANEKEQLSSPQRSRPQTLDIGSTKNVLLPGIIPTIRVNPPTPLQPTSTKPSTLFALSPTVSTALCTPQRKLNNITNRILKFEGTCLEKPVEPLQPEATNMLWQNETLVAGEKRMMRSSTSPALSAAQLDQKQLHRSRSFTLEQPSQALVEHMEREGKSPPSPSPPPVPPLPAELSPRCHIRLSSSSPAVGLAHLRRDTIESRAKQVQHSIKSSTQSPSISPSSSPTTAGADAIARRRGGSSTTARLQHQQKQLEELLQRALHETNDMLTDKEQIEHNKLSLAKRQMFTDIKIAHRDRFQQLVQYQREEQRRMQEEFERQQKFLIDQICTEINVSAYAHEPITTTLTSPSCISEYTSTSDLKTQTSPSNTFTLDSLDMTPRSLESPSQEDLMHTARKRLFDTDNDSESQLTMLQTTPKPLRQQNVSSSSRSSPPMRNVNQIKKPVQRNQTTTPPSNKKVISPVQSSSKSKSLTPTPARRVGNNSQNNKTTITKNTPPQQTMQMSKTRRSASPSRQTSEMQRRHEAATLLTAATRGFLVRRLFRTEQVQRIVQTIRDTLIFVLNLHMETYGSSLEQEEPSNIRLKARLLQQLCSASRTLHLIFFQTSIKERMEIIARDRKRIKTKLMAMHVKQRQ